MTERAHNCTARRDLAEVIPTETVVTDVSDRDVWRHEACHTLLICDLPSRDTEAPGSSGSDGPKDLKFLPSRKLRGQFPILLSWLNEDCLRLIERAVRQNRPHSRMLLDSRWHAARSGRAPCIG